MTADDALTPQARRELEAMDAALSGRPVEPALTELGALALALHDGRPAPRPVFTRELDARAAAGFPRRRRFGALRERLSGSVLLVPATALAAVLALVVTVSVVSSGPSDFRGGASGGGTSGGSEATSDQATQAQSESAGSTEPAPAVSGAGAPPSVGGSTSDGRRGRVVERSAALTIATRPAEVDRAAARIVEVTQRLDGFVVSQSVTSTAGGGSGDFVLRVPSARLAEALAQLSRVATVRERSQNAQDITVERVSARDRLTTARAYRRSLLRRLAAATTDAETQELRDRLDGVDRRIAAFRAELARVDNRAQYANVAVTLVGDPGAGGAGDRDDGSAWTAGDAARDAVRVLEVAAGVVLVALAGLLPLALLVALLLAARQLVVRRGRQRVLDAV